MDVQKYRVLEAKTSAELTRAVSAYMSNGYKLHGETIITALAVTNERDVRELKPSYRFFQAVVLDDNEIGDE